MINDDKTNRDLLARLEQLAQHLDRQPIPPLPPFRLPTPKPRPNLWKIAAWATGIAATIALAAWSASTFLTPPPHNPPAPIVVKIPAPTPAPAPRFFIVEDLDSYSVIDLNAGTPIVSFTRKDSDLPPSIAILPNDIAAAPTTKSHL